MNPLIERIRLAGASLYFTSGRSGQTARTSRSYGYKVVGEPDLRFVVMHLEKRGWDIYMFARAGRSFEWFPFSPEAGEYFDSKADALADIRANGADMGRHIDRDLRNLKLRSFVPKNVWTEGWNV